MFGFERFDVEISDLEDAAHESVLRHEAHPTRVSEELFERAIFGLRLVVIIFADEFTIDLFVRDQVVVKA